MELCLVVTARLAMWHPLLQTRAYRAARDDRHNVYHNLRTSQMSNEAAVIRSDLRLVLHHEAPFVKEVVG